MDPVRRQRWIRALLVVALLGSLASLQGVPAAAGAPPRASRDQRIDVVAFNVLAPIWAAPQFYPDDLDPALLDATYRRERLVAVLRTQAKAAEVVALQEVQASEFPDFADALGSAFDGFMVENDREFWSSYLTDDLPWQPNGTAIFIRRSAFTGVRFTELDLSDGNSIAVVSARHLVSDTQVRAASVHLDSDSQAARSTEFKELLGAWGPATSGTVDIVAGDFNEDVVTGAVGGVAERSGFESVLAAVGNREQTHPFLDSYNRSPKWGIIDHVMIRNGEPLDGDVLDFGVWSIADETERIGANLSATGSDHFPVIAGLRPHG